MDSKTEDKIFSICYENKNVQEELEKLLPKKKAKRLAKRCKAIRDICEKKKIANIYLTLQLDDAILTELEKCK